MTNITVLLMFVAHGAAVHANPFAKAWSGCLALLRGPAADPSAQPTSQIWRPGTTPPKFESWWDDDFTGSFNGTVRAFAQRDTLVFRFESLTPEFQRTFVLDVKARRILTSDDDEHLTGAPATMMFNAIKQEHGRTLINVISRPESDATLDRVWRGLWGLTKPVDGHLFVRGVYRGERTLRARAKRGRNFELLRGTRGQEEVFAIGAGMDVGETKILGRVHRLSFLLDERGQPLPLAWR